MRPKGRGVTNGPSGQAEGVSSDAERQQERDRLPNREQGKNERKAVALELKPCRRVFYVEMTVLAHRKTAVSGKVEILKREHVVVKRKGKAPYQAGPRYFHKALQPRNVGPKGCQVKLGPKTLASGRVGVTKLKSRPVTVRAKHRQEVLY